MMADVTEEERYGLIGLAIGLQNKDLPLITENLLKVNTSQADINIISTPYLTVDVSTAWISRRYNTIR